VRQAFHLPTVDKNRQIINWYRDIERVSKDDKADFEVMLLDHRDPTDASAALLGLTLNLVKQGFREEVMSLLFDATETDNVLIIQLQALSHLILLCEIYDTQLRRSRDMQERLLDMLSVHGENALKILIRTHQLQQLLHTQADKSTTHDIRSTLIYKLVVVGEKANRMFDRSC